MEVQLVTRNPLQLRGVRLFDAKYDLDSSESASLPPPAVQHKHHIFATGTVLPPEEARDTSDHHSRASKREHDQNHVQSGYGLGNVCALHTNALLVCSAN